MADDTITTIKLRNTTAHLKHISLAGGEMITVPPTDTGPGTEVKLESEAERVGFQRALATKSVKAWIEAGELVIDGNVPSSDDDAQRSTGSDGADSTPATPPNTSTTPKTPGAPNVPPGITDPNAATEPPNTTREQPTRTAVEPAQTTRRSSGRDHDRDR